MKCPTPITIKDKREWTSSKVMAVPCGKCGACKQSRRNMWIFRLEQEYMDAVNGFFITLTYSDENLVFNNKGEGYAILCKDHLQKFLKRYRYYHKKSPFEYPMRYYAVGEYGTKFGRPHYHILLFNLNIDLYSKLTDIWKLGFVDASSITGGAIAYVAKFHVNANEDEYDRVAEFATMSRNPGIGAGYLQRVKDWHTPGSDILRGYVRKGEYICSMPRYYREKVFDDVEKAGVSGQNQLRAEKMYNSEINRLRQFGIDNPDEYLWQSLMNDSQKVRRKKELDSL